ncbi:MAG: type II secretion system secretin GspD [Xanthomonadales bacterium]|nr:type II secretion system secretin GspD [Xanthomonadales bacterium]
MKSLIYAVAILLLVNSCATTDSEIPLRPEPHHQRLTKAELKADESPIFTSTANASEAGGVEEVELRVGESPFINEDAAKRKLSAVSEDGEIVLNFEGESLQSVVHTILGEVLQETFVIGPGVSGQVTFSTSKPVSRDQLMPILELLLRWNGAVMVFTEGRYHILPVAEAVRGNLVPILSENNLAMGYEVWVMPLKYIGVAEMAAILEPYVREGAMVRVDPLRNMIFLAGTQEELRNYQQTIDIFDVDWLAGMSVGIYPLNTVDVESITTELTNIFASEGESPLAGMFRFVPLERLASIMVITPQEAYLEKARKWIETLDRGAAGSGVQLYVYRVKNLEAQILANYLTQLFGGTTSSPRQDSNRGTLAPGLQEAQSSSINDFNSNRASANDRGFQDNRGGGGVVSTEEGEIRITSVIETNSLLIQATQNQYSSIQAAIERIDQEPLQVLIESQILDVVLKEDLEFGVSWYLTNNPDAIGGENPLGDGFDSLAMGGGENNFLANIIAPLGKGFIQATIAALDSVTDVRSLGAPSLLVRNNATATITVGTQVPVQSSSISTGGIGNVVSSAQYVSTGVTLTVTPRINPGGLVYMDVTQEVSRPGTRDPSISASGNPPIDNKSVTSQVAVQSGQTIFLGGLISEQSSKGRTGVPYLNRIPIFGNLFGSTKTNTTRSETVVMITPTVIENVNDLKSVSDDIRVEFMKIPPIKHATLHFEE